MAKGYDDDDAITNYSIAELVNINHSVIELVWCQQNTNHFPWVQLNYS